MSQNRRAMDNRYYTDQRTDNPTMIGQKSDHGQQSRGRGRGWRRGRDRGDQDWNRIVSPDSGNQQYSEQQMGYPRQHEEQWSHPNSQQKNLNTNGGATYQRGRGRGRGHSSQDRNPIANPDQANRQYSSQQGGYSMQPRHQDAGGYPSNPQHLNPNTNSATIHQQGQGNLTERPVRNSGVSNIQQTSTNSTEWWDESDYPEQRGNQQIGGQTFQGDGSVSANPSRPTQGSVTTEHVDSFSFKGRMDFPIPWPSKQSTGTHNDRDNSATEHQEHRVSSSHAEHHGSGPDERGRHSRDTSKDRKRDTSPDRTGYHNATGHSGRDSERDGQYRRDSSGDRNTSRRNEEGFKTPPNKNRGPDMSKDWHSRNQSPSSYNRNRHSDQNRWEDKGSDQRDWRKNDQRQWNTNDQREWNRNDRRGQSGKGRRSGNWDSLSPGSYHGYSSEGCSPQSNGPSPRRHFRDMDPMVHLSKTLSFILRHGAKKQGFEMMPGGFLYVEEILRIPELYNFTVKDVESVVANNDKQRFALTTDEKTGKLMIRANQGHTMEVEGLELTPIINANEAPTVIHGTYMSSWEIIKNEGLNRMGRNHIHFAAGEPGEGGVISGMRTSCQVIIKIDIDKALKDGIKFFRSANNVILSPGDGKGYIYPCYFESVVQRSPRMQLNFNKNISETDAKPKIPGLSSPGKKGKSKKKNKAKKEAEGDRKAKRQKDGEELEDILQGTMVLDEERNDQENWDESMEKIQDPIPEDWDDSTDKKDTSDREYWDESPEKIDTSVREYWDESPEKIDTTNTDTEMTGDLSKDSIEQSSMDDVKEEVITIRDADCCASAVLYLQSQEKVGIYCHITGKEEKLRNVICVTEKRSYNFEIIDDTIFTTAGGLSTFFTQKKPLKIFHGIALPAKVFLNDYGLLLDGTEVSDTKVLHTLVLETGSGKLLELKDLGFKPDDWAPGEGELETEEPYIKRCKVMLEVHDKMLGWLPGGGKIPKKEIFEEVRSSLDKEKEKQVKEAKKSANKNKEVGSSLDKEKEKQVKEGKKSANKNKKKRK